MKISGKKVLILATDGFEQISEGLHQRRSAA